MLHVLLVIVCPPIPSFTSNNIYRLPLSSPFSSFSPVSLPASHPPRSSPGLPPVPPPPRLTPAPSPRSHSRGPTLPGLPAVTPLSHRPLVSLQLLLPARRSHPPRSYPRSLPVSSVSPVLILN